MNFESFFNKYSFKEFCITDSKKILEQYHNVCDTDEDFIQYHEIAEIINYVNLYNDLFAAYNRCVKDNYEELYDEIEKISNKLESNYISCFVYSYYIYLFLIGLSIFDKNSNHSIYFFKNELIEKINWVNPKKFDYLNLSNSTLGYNHDKTSLHTDAYPDYRNFEISDGKLIKYKGNKRNLVIPSFVKSIAKSAFSNNSRIKMLIIPNSVTDIEEESFKDCKNLSLIYLGNKIKTIKSSTFENCLNLIYVIGESVKKVEENAFYNCEKLNSVSLDSIEHIDTQAFYNCKSFTDLYFSDNLKYIGKYAFKNSAIENLFLYNCKFIGDYAFENCLNLEKATINNEIKEIGKYIFKGCQKLKTLIFNALVTKTMSELFYDTLSLESLTVPSLIPNLCEDMLNLETVNVTGLTDIPDCCFSNCEELTKINFENKKINIIGHNAFYNCYSLEELDIDYYGDRIGEYSFYNCSIENFDFLNNVNYFETGCLSSCFLYNFDFFNKKFKKIGAFAFANSEFSDVINILLKNVEVHPGCFHGMKNINLFEIENSNLDYENFFSLFERSKEEFFDKVSIRSLITDFEIIEGLFENFNCEYIKCKLTDKVIPERVFNNCSNLSLVYIEGEVEQIGKAAFKDCKNLEMINYNQCCNLLVIFDEAFKNCIKYNFTDLINAVYIGDNAFENSNLSNIVFNENIYHIGRYAFKDCILGDKLVLPFIGFEKNDNVNNIYDIFGEPASLKNIQSLEILCKNINNSAFKFLPNLKNLSLPNLEKFNNFEFNDIQLNNISFGDKLREFSIKPLLQMVDKLKINFSKNNLNFTNYNGDIYSKDFETVYFAKQKLLNSVRNIKSYSMINSSYKELILKNIYKIENNSINLSNTKTLSLLNFVRIEPHSFINLKNLYELNITSNENQDLYRIFDNVDDVNISKLFIDMKDELSIRKLFSNDGKINIQNVVVINAKINENSFDDINISNLYLHNYSGTIILSNKINQLYIDSYLNIDSRIEVNDTIDEITINNVNQNTCLKGLKCHTLNLCNIENLSSYLLSDCKFENLNIDGLKNIESHLIEQLDLEKINIRNSSYNIIDNCLYYGKIFVYGKPNTSIFTISDNIKILREKSLNAENIKKLVLPESIQIEPGAIFNSKNIKELVCYKYNVKKLIDIFDNINALSKITFLSQDIPDNYLSEISNVESIILSDNINLIGNYCFYNDTRLTNISNFYKANIYGDFACCNCTNLNNIVINKNASFIGFHIFDNCRNLNSLSMPILLSPFFENINLCDYIGEVDDSLNIKLYGYEVPMEFCKNVKFNVRFMTKPKIIGDMAFVNSKNISIDLQNVESIGKYAFYESRLNGHIVLDKIKKLDNYCFSRCNGLKSIQIGSDLEYFDKNCLQNVALNSIKITSNNSKYNTLYDSILYMNNELLYCAPLNEYSEFVIPSFIKTINSYTFDKCENLKYIKLNGVENIFAKSFNFCSKLSKIDIENKLNYAQKGVFANCININSLRIANIACGEIKCISDYFDINNKNVLPKELLNLEILSLDLSNLDLDCDNNIEKIELSDKVEEIPDKYFSKCANLKSFVVPTFCKKIGNESFRNCTSLETISLNENIEEIGNYCFANTKIKNIFIPCSSDMLGENIFKDSFIESIHFKKSITKSVLNNLGLNRRVNTIIFDNLLLESNMFYNINEIEIIRINNLINNTLPNEAFINLKTIKKLDITSHVDIIGSHCFDGCENIDDIDLRFCKEIGDFAFRNCLKLRNINLTDVCHRIGDNAFENCYSFNSVILPLYVNLGNNVFLNCNNIKSINFQNKLIDFKLERLGFNKLSNVTNVEFNDVVLSDCSFVNNKTLRRVKFNKDVQITNQCFKDCIELESVDGNILSVGNESFSGCIKLTNIDLQSCTVIGNGAFSNCLSMKQLKLSNKCEKIYNYAFAYCNSLNEIIIPSETKVDNNFLEGCTHIENLVLHNKLNKFKLSNLGLKTESLLNIILYDANLDDKAFIDCTNLTSIEIKNPIYITNQAFSNCVNLQKIDAQVIGIGNNAFEECIKLDCLNLSHCKSIGDKAFKNCNSLLSVEIEKITSIGEKILDGCLNIEKLVLHNELNNFKLSNLGLSSICHINTVEFDDIVLDVGAFANFTNLERVKFNKDVNIPDNCFENCTSLLEINISPLSIGKLAFKNCNKLVDINLMNSKHIDNNAFESCEGLTKIELFKDTTIGDQIVHNCNNIIMLKLHNSLKEFSLSDLGLDPTSSKISELVFDNVTFTKGAFQNFISLDKISLRKDIKFIPDKCFSGCSNLKFDTDIFKNVTEIGEEAFVNCQIGNKLDLNNVKKIGKYAFSSTMLEDVILGDDLKVIPEGCFFKSSKLKSVKLPINLTTIKKLSFSGTNITKLNISDKIKLIESLIFKDNINSVEINIKLSKNNKADIFESNWQSGLCMKHRFLKIMNPKVKVKYGG